MCTDSQGVLSYTASGSGTLILPGNIILKDVLQVIYNGFSPFEWGSGGLNYIYFHASQKYPVLMLDYRPQDQNYKLLVNKTLVVGIQTQDFSDGICLYPNPTASLVSFNGLRLDGTKITLHNVTGEQVECRVIDSSLDLHELPMGLYFLKLKITDTKSVEYKILKINPD
jgi:hypothetical protein